LGRRRILIVFTASIAAALAARPGAFAGAGLPASREVRTVPVTVVADPRLGTNEAWKVDVTRIVMDVNPYFREAIGVRLKVETFDYLETGTDPSVPAGSGRPLLRSLRSWLPAFLGNSSLHMNPEGGILIGLVPEGPDGPVNPGIADYLNSIIVLKYLKAKGGMTYVLLHEVCHIFGAVDLMETGSVMSLRDPSFRIDGFTRSIMRVNRHRSFRRGECPLSAEKMLEAAALYAKRDSLGLGERQLRICLDKLRAMIAARNQTRPGK
jgi:hypothetical protein